MIVVAGAGVWRAWHDWGAAGPLAADTALVIPHGNTLKVLRTLVADDVLAGDCWHRDLFLLGTWLTRKDGSIHAAELMFPAHISMQGALTVLRHASPVEHHLTVPEGWTAHQIGEALSHNALLSGDVPPIGEGTLLPQTVSFTRDTPRAEIVRRLRQMMRETLDQVWQDRDPAVPLSSKQQLLVLASIVERETGLEDERSRVARVFFNRLARGMPLQSDPTVIYDLSDHLGVLARALTHDDLAEPGPSNTYLHKGLPESPICSPGRAALEAVAHPSGGDDLYFVATGKGGHHFAASLSAHNRNVARYRATRKETR